MDSGGLGELVRTLTTMQKHGGSLKVANLPKRVQDLLVMTRLVTVFDTFEDEGSRRQELRPLSAADPSCASRRWPWRPARARSGH